MLVFDGVPSTGNALGELELVVFVAVPSLCSLNGSSLLSLSTSAHLLLLSVSPVLFGAVVDDDDDEDDVDDVDSLSFALFVVVGAVGEIE